MYGKINLKFYDNTFYKDLSQELYNQIKKSANQNITLDIIATESSLEEEEFTLEFIISSLEFKKK